MLRDPSTALLLYVLLVVVGFLFGKRWQGVRDAIMAAGQMGQTKATTSGG